MIVLRLILFSIFFLLAGCFTLKDVSVKGVVNNDDQRITPQKPPGVDNTISIIF